MFLAANSIPGAPKAADVRLLVATAIPGMFFLLVACLSLRSVLAGLQTGRAAFLHSGRMDTIEKVLDVYRHSALLAQGGTLRNADPQIGLVSIDGADEKALAAFLRSLNEDYD